MSVLSLCNYTLSIRGTPILRDISLDLAEGEILALTGESGSGKSMTALAAMQLLPDGSDQSGQVTLGGTELTSQDEGALCALRGCDIAMIFQEPMTALNPVQNIGRQIREPLRLHRALSRAEADTHARAALDKVGLKDIPLSRYPFELSGGQRQRVAIAMALALRPRLLIADEPTTALDVTTQAEILTLLKTLVATEGMALMMITHDLAVVADMADRIAVMHRGEIVEQDTTARLFATMAHPYTRKLFAASAHQPALPDPETGTPVLQVTGATRRYPLPRAGLFGKRRSFTAVNNVSFTLQAGQRLGLVGESGCGKSTLTRAILGLEPLQDGQITAFDSPVGADMPGNTRARLQVVFQDPYGSFNPRHSVARILSEPFHLLETPPDAATRQTKIARALEDVGLAATDADRFIHTFSGGQRQRIAIARALINDPDVIVFDEAVSALDVRVRAQVLDLIAELSRNRGLAWLFISHDLSVVRGITDDVMVMQRGEIVEQGPTAQVFAQPQHPYTQRLIAAAPKLPDLEIDDVPA